ncbi:MAG: phosphoadenosine phosphosulfate reductase family protein [Rhodobacteraceae bacterium]|nr:phosphoadenosine phosphosulfate reductase family protein [Paracoccaceae bacterium]
MPRDTTSASVSTRVAALNAQYQHHSATAVLPYALAPFDAWITGHQWFQGEQREPLEFFEAKGDVRIRINPLAYWTPGDVQDYIANDRLPRHPLVAKGDMSIGCAPCISPVALGADLPTARWPDSDRNECKGHFINGRIVCAPVQRAS